MKEKMKPQTMRVTVSSDNMGNAEEYFEGIVKTMFENWMKDILANGFKHGRDQVTLELLIETREDGGTLKYIITQPEEHHSNKVESDERIAQGTTADSTTESDSTETPEVTEVVGTDETTKVVQEEMQVPTKEADDEPEDSSENQGEERAKGRELIPEELITKAKWKTSINEIVELMITECDYPLEMKEELTSIFEAAQRIWLKGLKISWANLETEGFPNDLEYKKKMVAPIREKYGRGLRFTIFVKEMLTCMNMSLEQRIDGIERPTRTGALEGVKNILGITMVKDNDGQGFLQALTKFYCNNDLYSIPLMCNELFSIMYNCAKKNGLSSEEENKHSGNLLAYCLRPDVVPGISLEASLGDFAKTELPGPNQNDELMTVFLETGRVVTFFMNWCFGLDMNLWEFAKAMRPILVNQKQ